MEKTVRDTSKAVMDEMLSLKSWFAPRNARILEPSAGRGNLAAGIKETYPGCIVDCCELNKSLREELRSAGHNVIGGDFMLLDINPIYDAVIAAPPFKDNVDVIHIMRMYEFLLPGGTLISLTHPAWTMRNAERQVKFRGWLNDRSYWMKMLPDRSFVENYETQPTALLIIRKPL